MSYPPKMQRFDFYVDCLNSNDGDFYTTDSIEAYDLDNAIDAMRDRYYDQGDRIVRLVQKLPNFETKTVYLMKGIDA